MAVFQFCVYGQKELTNSYFDWSLSKNGAISNNSQGNFQLLKTISSVLFHVDKKVLMHTAVSSAFPKAL